MNVCIGNKGWRKVENHWLTLEPWRHCFIKYIYVIIKIYTIISLVGVLLYNIQNGILLKIHKYLYGTKFTLS